MNAPASHTDTSQELPDLVAINLSQRLGMWSDGTTSPITLHDEDGDEVDESEDAVFVTTPTPDGKWAAAQLADYTATRH
jgi:hypothetical protein